MARAHSAESGTDTRRAPHVARLVVVLGAVLGGGVAAHAGLGAFGAEVGPPKPRITSAPAKTTVSRAATFGVDSAPSVTLECSLDGAEFRRCSSRPSYRRLTLGGHTFRVRARSDVGHTGSPTSYDWSIRARPQRATPPRVVPRPILRTMPTRPYASPNATFAWRPRGEARWQHGTTFVCSLDGSRWARCPNPVSYDRLGSGVHVFRVLAVLHGTTSRDNSFTWRIQLRIPGRPTVTRRPMLGGSHAVFDFEAEDAAGFVCLLDDGPWTACASPVVLEDLGAGTHELCVRAVSSQGVPGPETCVTWVESSSVGPPPPPSPSPTRFSISGDLPATLTPGSGGSLPLVVSNPNGFDIVVTQLVVTVEAGSSRAGCDGPANLAVTQSNTAAAAVSVVVPANGSVTLPAQGATAPVVSMLDLPSNQDACKNAVFSLSFTGTATR